MRGYFRIVRAVIINGVLLELIMLIVSLFTAVGWPLYVMIGFATLQRLDYLMPSVGFDWLLSQLERLFIPLMPAGTPNNVVDALKTIPDWYPIAVMAIWVFVNALIIAVLYQKRLAARAAQVA
jgi:hypothetical protein